MWPPSSVVRGLCAHRSLGLLHQVTRMAQERKYIFPFSLGFACVESGFKRVFVPTRSTLPRHASDSAFSLLLLATCRVCRSASSPHSADSPALRKYYEDARPLRFWPLTEFICCFELRLKCTPDCREPFIRRAARPGGFFCAFSRSASVPSLGSACASSVLAGTCFGFDNDSADFR
jgi:hypothetical protein